ncbi:MAG: T9SS type A sorting domain-containing protein, partial [Muribaculaceae bacterium]|nr:T9SS type A sorting domain-containing protein [Muribaculaceae bacterium]
NFNSSVLDARTRAKVKDLNCRYSVVVAPGFLGRITVPPSDFGLAPGDYMWYVTDHDGNAISLPSPLIVTSPTKTAGTLAYVVADEQRKLARVVAPENGVYSTGMTVPATIGGYTIKEISPDAFAFAESQEIALSAEINCLPDGAFYEARALRNLQLDATTMVKAEAMTFNPAYAADCYLQVPEELTYTYRAARPWSTFRMTNWELELENVEITSGMMIDPSTGKPYSPYYINCLTPVTISLSAPDGMNVEVLVVHNGECIEYHTIDPRTTTVTLPPLGRRSRGRLQATATTNPVAVDTVTDDGAPVDVYSIDGRLVLDTATPEDIRSLAPGIYIISGRKYIVR